MLPRCYHFPKNFYSRVIYLRGYFLASSATKNTFRFPSVYFHCWYFGTLVLILFVDGGGGGGGGVLPSERFGSSLTFQILFILLSSRQ